MTKEERLERMKVGSYLPEHGKVAAEVLEEVKKEAKKRNVTVSDDIYWPWHIFTVGTSLDRGGLVSIFCKGFRRNIEVQVLTNKGLADQRFKEMGFTTARGAINYILKLQDKWRNPKR